MTGGAFVVPGGLRPRAHGPSDADRDRERGQGVAPSRARTEPPPGMPPPPAHERRTGGGCVPPKACDECKKSATLAIPWYPPSPEPSATGKESKMLTQLWWQRARSGDDSVLDETRVLYAVAHPQVRKPLYIGKADGRTVHERAIAPDKDDFWDWHACTGSPPSVTADEDHDDRVAVLHLRHGARLGSRNPREPPFSRHRRMVHNTPESQTLHFGAMVGAEGVRV